MPAISRTSTAAAPPRSGVGRFRYVVAGLIVLVYTVAAADRANIGIALPTIRAEYALSNGEAGALASLFFVFYALGQMPSGFLVGRANLRWLMPAAMGLTSLFTALTGLSGSILSLQLARAALGAAEAPLPLGILATINRWSPSHEKDSVTGLFLAATKLGLAIAPPLGALLIGLYGWRAMFLVFAAPGLLFAAAWALLVSDDPARGC